MVILVLVDAGFGFMSVFSANLGFGNPGKTLVNKIGDEISESDGPAFFISFRNQAQGNWPGKGGFFKTAHLHIQP